MNSEFDQASRADQQQQVQARRRQSKMAQNQNELLGVNLEKSKLDRNEITQLLYQFKKSDKPVIQFIDLLNIAKKINYEVDSKVKEFIFKELEARNIKKIDIDAAIIVLSQVKTYYQKLDEENENSNFNEYVDAFVALGGNPDQTGKVSKQTILQIIKTEFELTYDMEVFLEKIEAGGEFLDFPTFCMLFEQNDEGRGLTKTNSVLSLLSNRSRKSVKSNNSLKVRYKDFEKFYDQMEQQEQQYMNTRNQFQEYDSQNIPSSP
ncbi:hypothetical protein ABPG72_004026 [Tetrahymena utriculariae]